MRSCATWSGPGCWSTSSTGRPRDPEWEHEVIRDELRAHDPALLEKPMLVAFNKLDLPGGAGAPGRVPRARARPRASRSWRIAAATGEGIDD